jgi:hypothetical protein
MNTLEHQKIIKKDKNFSFVLSLFSLSLSLSPIHFNKIKNLLFALFIINSVISRSLPKFYRFKVIKNKILKDFFPLSLSIICFFINLFQKLLIS